MISRLRQTSSGTVASSYNQLFNIIGYETSFSLEPLESRVIVLVVHAWMPYTTPDLSAITLPDSKADESVQISLGTAWSCV